MNQHWLLLICPALFFAGFYCAGIGLRISSELDGSEFRFLVGYLTVFVGFCGMAGGMIGFAASVIKLFI